MKKGLKICAVVGLCLVLAGGILLAAGVVIAGREAWEQAKEEALHTEVLETVPEQEVNMLDISLKAGELTVVRGETLKVTRYDGEASFDCYVRGDTLVIEEKEEGFPGISLFGIHIGKNGVVRQRRKVVLEVPEDMVFSSVEWSVDAGSLEAECLTVSGDFRAEVNAGSIQIRSLTAEGSVKVDVAAGSFEAGTMSAVGETRLNVDAGSIEVGDFSGKDTETSCNVGSVQIKGEILGQVRADCSMGSIVLELEGIRERYRYTGSCDMGTVSIGGVRLGDYRNTGSTDAYSMELSCSMGSIEITEK